MMLKKWGNLPVELQKPEVKQYYDILSKRKLSLFFKRVFDVLLSVILLVLLSPIIIILMIAIPIDSKGNPFYLQTRVTQYYRHFKIIKFRTMQMNADKLGTEVTLHNDPRITRLGKIIRKNRLDEIPQLLNILIGDMTFVGTRPEVPRYVAEYTNEMMATLLVRAGVTSSGSIEYREEQNLLKDSKNPEETYIYEVLPAKMKYNLNALLNFNLFADLKVMIKTIVEVFFS